MGILMLMAMAAPSAHAAFLETYYDFEDGDFSSDSPGLQPTTISFTPTSYPGGHIAVVDNGAGTNENAVTASTNFALELGGNSTDASAQYCFFLGGLTTTGLLDVTLSFAILSEGDGTFTTLNLLYSTTGLNGTYNPLGSILSVNQILTYKTFSFTSPALEGVSSDNLFFEFCFTGSTNASSQTFIDNIQVTAVPEPSTYIGGLLGIVGLCWYQRRRLTRFLSLRPA